MANRPSPHSDTACRSSAAMIVRLSAMMFLQYWPLGTWGVTVGTFIAANTGSQGAGIFSAGFVGYSTAASAIGSLLSPVIVGFLSDKYLPAQFLLSMMHVGCACAAWGMYESESQTAFFLCLLGYFQCFVPAATLTNKIALKQLANGDAEYPIVRIFGTVGWILSGLFLGFVWPQFTGGSIDESRTPLMIGAWGSVAMALYSATLPHTPPELGTYQAREDKRRDFDVLLRNRRLIGFLLILMLACIPSMAYNNYANLFLNRQAYPRPAALMTLGQISDVLCLWATPWLIPRFGLRFLFISGVTAWAIRYGLLAVAGQYYEMTWAVYAAILIHGPCYVFVYVIGVMYVDRLVDGTHRGIAQGMNALATTGVGHLLGAITVGLSQEAFLTPDGVAPPPYNWAAFWLVPAAISAATILVMQISLMRPRHDLSQ
jgi:nucleoside transporter